MHDDRDRLVLTLAGRAVTDAWDRIRRYCGLAWSGGPPETWAFRYYDAITWTAPTIKPVDVVIAGALHRGLTRAELAFFWDHFDELTDWIEVLPPDVALADVDDTVVAHVDGLARWADVVPLSLLTKVLHRTRPALVPLVDREVLDWYRPVTGERTATRAWPGLVRALRADLQRNAVALDRMASALAPEAPVRPSALRLVDIAIWMGATR